MAPRGRRRYACVAGRELKNSFVIEKQATGRLFAEPSNRPVKHVKPLCQSRQAPEYDPWYRMLDKLVQTHPEFVNRKEDGFNQQEKIYDEQRFKEGLSERFHNFARITSQRLLNITGQIDTLAAHIKRLDEVVKTLSVRSLMQMNRIEAAIGGASGGNKTPKYYQ